MIRHLHIRNFQRHRRLRIELDPHITTLVGESDAGKSTIVRALRWLCLNETPRGKWIHHGKTSASVSINIDDHEITRAKKGGVSSYTLDGKRFVAFGKEVPDEIAKLLNISEVCFQKQIEQPFWFSKTPGEVSRQLNMIVDLGDIDTTLGNLATMLRRTKAERDVVKERVREAVAEKLELEWVKAANADLCEVERLGKERLATTKRIEKLAELLQEAKVLGEAAERSEGVEAMAAAVRSLERLSGSVGAMWERVERLETLLTDHGELVRLIGYHQGELRKAHGEWNHHAGEECPLCGGKVVKRG